jgi:hypothetical protein
MGGDFNQGLSGRDYVGTRQNRATLVGIMEKLELQTPTVNSGALIEGHPAIDLIALPSSWTLRPEPRRFCPERNGRHLSDHALYLVQEDAY